MKIRRFGCSLLERFANGDYFPLSYSRAKVDERAAYHLTVSPGR